MSSAPPILRRGGLGPDGPPTLREPRLATSPGRRAAFATLLIAFALAPSRASPQPILLPLERPNDLQGAPAGQTSIAAHPTFGRFVSVQVNVNASGANIVGDAGNEPTIVVDPFDHDRMAIGWRQFDSIRSDFRQAGFATSSDGGQSWTAGKIQPGVWRSDPVLGADSQGNFFYLSLDQHLATQVFASTNHGMTWGPAVSSYGWDKPWMAVDGTSGPGQGHLYETWSQFGNPYAPNTFVRSEDDGASFLDPSFIPGLPAYGTIAVGADGTVYAVGNADIGGIVVARSTDAKDGVAVPTFTTSYPDLGGAIRGASLPNPEGLLGQLWIAVDRSPGPRAGWVYVLASVITPTDPLDVHFIRSSDGGATWSAPVRVNDDPTGTRAYQWFGTLSVAPNGRIDAVWNDTRGSPDSTLSALYYSYSTDGGVTWSANEQASPTWSSTVGFPKQKKIGDYYQMVSDAGGADLAYAATFNNEEDVYYLRLTPAQLAAAPDAAAGFALRPSAPNPFRSATTIPFAVPPGGAPVRIDVLDLGGRRVATLVDGFRDGGAHTTTWSGVDANGRPAAAGLYFCRYRIAGHEQTRRMALVR